MNDQKKVDYTNPACASGPESFAARMRKEGFAAFAVRVIKAENSSGGCVTVIGLPAPETWAASNGIIEDGDEVSLPTGVIGNLEDAVEHVGCWIDLAIRADYANGNKNLVPFAWHDDHGFFKLKC